MTAYEPVVYEPVIGLEVHIELKTETKIFCHSSTAFGAGPNRHTCPVCLGLPGVLPVINKKVVDFAIKAGLALNCRIAPYSKFDRKNYYYPDLPKNYQVSQYELPIAAQGFLDIEVDGSLKRVGITRIHMEEDAGKLVHQETVDSDAAPYSLVDYNRTGVPLIEIVSEPDLRSPAEAVAYLEKLKAIIQYTGISDCKMQEGSLRCDANISVRPAGQQEFGVRAELKNMNSFKALQKALVYEIERQTKILADGGAVIQETRAWDENRGVTLSLRGKEEAHDYRYFPEPDLPPMIISAEWVDEIRNTLPELPDERKDRFISQYGLPPYDAMVLTTIKEMADFYEQCVEQFNNYKLASNWLMGDLARLMHAHNMEITQVRLQPAQLAQMLRLLEEGAISGKIAKTVFEKMFNTGQDPDVIVKEKGLAQISDAGAIESVIDSIIANNPRSAEDYRAGKTQALGFLVGQVMQATKGQANPGLVNKILKEKL